MAGFLYYLPGYTDAGLEEIKTVKLGYAFGRRCTCLPVVKGPDGLAGVVVADESRLGEQRIGYYPEVQTWRRVPQAATPLATPLNPPLVRGEAGVKVASGDPAGPGLKVAPGDLGPWVGFYSECPPMPDDLARERMLEGHRVTLGDENDWLIPIARGCQNDESELVFYQALPTGVGVDDQGNWIADGVLPKYAVLWQIAMLYWTAFRAASDGDWEDMGDELAVQFDLAEAADKALTVLAANYHLGKIEVAVLGLFNDVAISSILQALVDWPGVQQWLKKKRMSQA